MIHAWQLPFFDTFKHSTYYCNGIKSHITVREKSPVEPNIVI